MPRGAVREPWARQRPRADRHGDVPARWSRSGSTFPVFGTVQFYLDGQATGPPIGVANGTTGPIWTSIGVTGLYTLSAVFSGTPEGYASSTGATDITVTSP